MHRRSILFVIMSGCLQLSAQQPFGTAPDSARLFHDLPVNSGMYERDFALSPDGNEVFYTIQLPLGSFQSIVHLIRNASGKWSKPELASFAGHYSDLEPSFSPDGKRLFFASNRPVNGDQPKDFDIWFVERTSGGWGTPVHIGAPVATDADEYYPAVAVNGNLYFTAAYPNALGKEDIYRSEWVDGRYQQPVPLDSAVNSSTYEFNAYVSPDEQFILFTSYGRKDDHGRGDLYLSRKNAAGKWQPAVNLAIVNSDRLDYCPFVSFDKKMMFFTSERHRLPRSFAGRPADIRQLQQLANQDLNGGGNIYWISFEAVLKSIGFTGNPSVAR